MKVLLAPGVATLLRNSFACGPRATSRRHLLCAVCAWASFALTLLIPAGSHLIFATHARWPVATLTSDEISSEPVRSERSNFRLGNAARPFGWSTAIGDFNKDGKPDVAVADYIGPRTSGYAYRLEFSVSGLASHDVTFDSNQDAVTVSVADVDRDNDLDVIIRTPLTGETVGIWLNDGQGNFTAGDVRQVPSTIRSLQSFDTTDPLVHFAAFEVSPRRADDALLAAFGVTLEPSGRQSALSRSHTVRSALSFTQTSPRAPPSAALHSLS